MKKIIIFIAIVALFILSGCQEDNVTDKNNYSNNSNNNNQNISSDSKSIVIYFSRTNNTEKIANFIIDITGSDKYEIEAKIPYTDEDIQYYTDCRADREQNDPSARPEIGSVEIDLKGYDVIYLGYPIWHGKAPKIMYTFIESYNLENKTIVPFCTSASSPMGSSATELYNLTKQGTWLDGKRFSSTATSEEVKNWIDSLVIDKKEGKKLVMTIDGIKVDVTWEDNESVKELMEYAKDEITIKMNIYGGFEQVGSIGKNIKSNDTQINTNPGDIVLYNSNNIVVFFGTNSWSYTKLGHVNLSNEELNKLLNKDSVILTIEIKK